MQSTPSTETDRLCIASNGLVYRISPDCIVIDRHRPVQLPYAAFLRLSSRELQVGIETFLSPNSTTNGYTSQNVSVVHIPGIGMAWATRFCTTIPTHVAQTLGVADACIGSDFLFLWPPSKALAAYLTVLEHTRLDNLSRFLAHCAPTPSKLFSDWNVVIPQVATPVDLATLSVGQRIFAASLRPMVHLASPRYTIDLYCSHRLQEELFEYNNAPIQLKYSGLKRMRRGENEFPGGVTQARNNAVDFFVGSWSTRHRESLAQKHSNGDVASEFKILLHGETDGCSATLNPTGERCCKNTLRGEITWETNVPYDVQGCIVEASVQGALNMMDEKKALAALRNTRLVCKSFQERVDVCLHAFFTNACSSAKQFCDPVSGMQRLDGLLLKRMWWDTCRLPYTELLAYQSDTARHAVARFALAVVGNSHKPYPHCCVSPATDPSNEKRYAAMLYLQKNVNYLAVL